MKSFAIRLVILACSSFVFWSCSSTRTASYNYAQKQIEKGDLDFENRLKVDEYINAFPQQDFGKPDKNADVKIRIDYFTTPTAQKSKNLAQVFVRTREANEIEKSKSFGISVVLDISGSMSQENKFEDAISALKAMVLELPVGTEFSLVTFSTNARVDFKPTEINAKTRNELLDVIGQLHTEGSTNIEDGLVFGYKAMAEFKHKDNSRLLLLTDGQSNVGTTSPQEMAKKANVNYLEGARISTIGLGHDVDEFLLRLIAEKGNGAYYFAENGTALKNLFLKDLNSVMIPVVKQTQLKISANNGTRIHQVIGYGDVLKDGVAEINIGEMNSDDWRVYILEVEGEKNKIEISAELSDVIVANGSKNKLNIKTAMTTSGSKPEMNKFVARNSILFSNAMTLIEISKLSKQKKFTEAIQIMDIQLANMDALKSWDSSPEIAREYSNLVTVKSILENKGLVAEANDHPIVNPADVPQGKSQVGSNIKRALQIAEKAVPGSWSLVLGLLQLFFD